MTVSLVKYSIDCDIDNCDYDNYYMVIPLESVGKPVDIHMCVLFRIMSRCRIHIGVLFAGASSMACGEEKIQIKPRGQF